MNSLLFVISENQWYDKIRKMKKPISTTLFLLLTALPCFCIDNFSFSIAPRASVTFGTLEEIVYDSPNGDAEIISLLEWEQKPLIDIGLSAALQYNHFIFSTGFDYSFPIKTSYMSDYDWDWGELDSYTKHPILSSKNICTELSVGHEINISPKLSVIPAIQFDYIYNSFEADRGSGVRGGRKIRGYGIDYTRHSFFTFTGLAVKAELTSRFFLTAEFYTALWSHQVCEDYHHGVKNPFTTIEAHDGYFKKYKARVSTGYNFNKLISLELFSQFIFGFPDTGTFSSDKSTDKIEPVTSQKGGSAIHSAKFGTSLKFTF